jgi:hypothetical protein
MKKNEKTCVHMAKGCRTAKEPLPWLFSLPCAGPAFAVRWFFAVRWLHTLPCLFSLPCAVLPLCRALLVAVRCMAPLPCSVSLPCTVLLSHGKEIFAV